ncbi:MULTISPECIES: mannose-6-phosphate isomerase, class I [unclassified Vibrio]|uniref:Mannose-6-phosphate isomerase n=1 Tax=Vibrio sp. HB236076 TaxID=3232307 RepID=A0AB39HFA4_9VIBR|nr:mannose-6-phosphate isomerase, class I [Vibrio sp. HB161653]MDP5252880.1 mannose-6-phosphate isomerase, class I [Vibrio sp. HB161653]
MSDLLFKLDNPIQHYSWGSQTSIEELFGIANPSGEPQAEMWMGAHPNGCSKIAGTDALISEIINQDKAAVLGTYTSSRFGELPFLFKVLAAKTPLSIQVHPNKANAEIGFERENQQGIPLNAAHRNYKDPNHKPELVYALTFYKAMNGFRPIKDIISLFEQAKIDSLQSNIEALKAAPGKQQLQSFFSALMTLEGERKSVALEELNRAIDSKVTSFMAREALQYARSFREHYPGDIGLFAPLFLNTIELAPGEAMFLHAETPHAYVEGTALEIMANSDNVLRAGLTPKYIDVPELIANTKFVSIEPQDLKLAPVNKQGRLSYPIPVDDFAFEIVTVEPMENTLFVRSAEILFCIEGEITVDHPTKTITLKAGESILINHLAEQYQYHGQGRLARAFN